MHVDFVSCSFCTSICADESRAGHAALAAGLTRVRVLGRCELSGVLFTQLGW